MPTVNDPIERINDEAQATVDALNSENAASLRAAADDIFRRAIVLAIGSYCEKRIMLAIEKFADRKSGSSLELCSFIKNKALFRQYHTFFSWDKNNANSFLKLFGVGFQETFGVMMTQDGGIEDGVRCFVQLGALRNKLAHESFAEYPLNLSRDDVMRDYRKALQFVAAFERALEAK